jgi:exocyst complex component 1
MWYDLFLTQVGLEDNVCLLLSRLEVEQVNGIEHTKLTSKKRQGIASFIKYFPIYVARIESQLVGADDLDIRANVDEAYEKIVQTMFDSLKQMAKMDRDAEDKGQLNYHVILIGT